MEVFKTFLDQLTKNVKEAPGWLPLIIACYLAMPFVAERYTPSFAIYADKYAEVIGPFLALVLYVLGDALDQAVFPGTKKGRPKGWQWLAPPALKKKQCGARRALLLNTGFYAVSKSVVEAADGYKGSWIQVKNESAKFVRSVVLPVAVLGLVMLLRGQWLYAGLALTTSVVLLIIYGRLKGWHMCDLYTKVVELSGDTTRYEAHDLGGSRLYFWEGMLVSSASRGASRCGTSEQCLPTADSKVKFDR
jgi:hypothetical protein